MFEYCEGLKFQATIYQRGGCESLFILTGNSMVQGIKYVEDFGSCQLFKGST
ncbi:hypothetical protein ACJIZ3_002896 [Penstemon smallii]|uniref:Uncharacterized protein n=1 Tax=Penstemon smallii TaxID=265156 RepID=A0ABD3UBH0_9LAMI